MCGGVSVLSRAPWQGWMRNHLHTAELQVRDLHCTAINIHRFLPRFLEEEQYENKGSYCRKLQHWTCAY